MVVSPDNEKLHIGKSARVTKRNLLINMRQNGHKILNFIDNDDDFEFEYDTDTRSIVFTNGYIVKYETADAKTI